MAEADRPENRLKVFISYSRADAKFADELVAGLEFKGSYTVTIDRHSIIEGEDWKKRLGALITDADTIVFLLSPDSAKSDICRWEIEHAHALSKRILPALVRPLGGERAPEKLAALNYVRFDDERSFMAGLAGLDRALKADVDWLREHTRLLTLAQQWESGGSRENRLLSGADIEDAKKWVARRPLSAPEPTRLHLDFIRASEDRERARELAARQEVADRERLAREREEAAAKAEEQARKAQEAASVAEVAQKELALATKQAAEEQRRRMRLRNAVYAALVVISGLVLFGWFRLEARRQLDLARQADRQFAEERARTQSRYVALQANQLTASGDPGTALNLLLEDLERLHESDFFNLRLVVPETHYSMVTALYANQEQNIFTVGSEARSVGYSPLGEIVVAADRGFLIFDKAGGRTPKVRLQHGGALLAAAFDRSGERVLTASRDGKARIWTRADGSMREFAHSDEVTAARFDGDERRIATASRDDTAAIWEVATGQRLYVLPHDSDVSDLAWSPDGTRLYTVTQLGAVRAWDARTGAALFTVARQGQRLSRIRVNRDGTRLATSGRQGPATLLSASDGSVVAHLSHGRSNVWAVEFSPTDDLVATTGSNLGTSVWDSMRGALLFTLQNHTNIVTGATFSPDGSRLMTWSPDRTARIYSACDGRELATLESHTEDVVSAAFSPDGCSVVTGSGDATARTWDLIDRPGQQVLAEQRCTPAIGRQRGERCRSQAAFAEQRREVLDSTFSRDGTLVATGTNDRGARVYDVETAELRGTLPAQSQPIVAVAFDATGNILLTAQGDIAMPDRPGTLRLWNWREQRELIDGGIVHTGSVRSAAYSPDGTRILTSSGDGLVQIFDAKTGALILRIETPASPHCGDKPCQLSGASWSPNGKQVASASYGYKACIWDVDGRTGVLEKPDLCIEHKHIVYSVSWNHRGTHIVTASGDGTAVIWDARSGEAVSRFSGRHFDFRSAQFFDNDRQLVTAHNDYAIRFWSAVNRQELARVDHRNAQVSSVSIDATGRYMLTSSADGLARAWVLPTLDVLVDAARSTLKRCLSRSQREEYNLAGRDLPAWCAGKLHGPASPSPAQPNSSSR